MVASSPEEAFAGQYGLHPGCTPAITGHRPILAPGCLAGLLQGQDLPRLLRTLGSVFTLCANAHQTCAQQAYAAALAQESGSSQHVDLTWLTARDHLRSVALDWPARLLPQQPPDLSWLQGCPVGLGGAVPQDAAAATQQMHALAHWLKTALLHEPLQSWLARCANDAGLLDWCQGQRSRCAPARALLHAEPLRAFPALTLQPLPVGDTEALQALAHALWNDADFCQHPSWQGRCAETGPWIRARHPEGAVRTPWTRLASRLRELVELAAGACAGQPPVLAQGALKLAPHCGVAWCEMARGLLLHSVRLDDRGLVQDYRVLAPTEWNFHPNGSLGQAVASLALDDRDSARLLAAAFDPCVACL